MSDSASSGGWGPQVWGLVLAAVLVVVVYGVLLWGLYFDGFKKASSSTSGTRARFRSTSLAARNAARTGKRGSASAFNEGAVPEGAVEILIDDLDAPTEQQMSTYGLSTDMGRTNHRIYVDSGSRAGSSTPFYFNHEFTTENSDKAWYTFVKDTRDGDKWVIVFLRQAATDLTAPVTNVSGAFTSLYAHAADDMFAAGFQPGDDTFSTYTEEAFTAMVAGMSAAKVLVGAQPGAAHSSSQRQYEFNVQSADPFAVAVDDTFPTLRVDGTVPSMKGGFRIALTYVDYVFELAGGERAIRLFINHPVYGMATKAVRDTDGVFKFVELAETNAPTLVPASGYATMTRPLTFWDQPGGSDAQNWLREGDDQTVGNLFQTFFRATVLGLPVAVSNASNLDFAAAEGKTVTVDLVADPQIAFRAAKDATRWGREWTETQLAASPEWQAILFDIPGITLRAEIIVE
jgi:hypothetical protein